MYFPSVASDKAILVLCSDEGRDDPSLACAVFEWIEIYYEIKDTDKPTKESES
jgi:hypothetical protein